MRATLDDRHDSTGMTSSGELELRPLGPPIRLWVAVVMWFLIALELVAYVRIPHPDALVPTGTWRSIEVEPSGDTVTRVMKFGWTDGGVFEKGNELPKTFRYEKRCIFIPIESKQCLPFRVFTPTSLIIEMPDGLAWEFAPSGGQAVAPRPAGRSGSRP